MPLLLAVHAPVHATVRVPEAGEGPIKNESAEEPPL
jgi:hypothetical protein